jgi:hypothetical protein
MSDPQKGFIVDFRNTDLDPNYKRPDPKPGDPFGIAAAPGGRTLSYRPPEEVYRASDGYLRNTGDNSLYGGCLPQTAEVSAGLREPFVRPRGNPRLFDPNPRAVGKRYPLVEVTEAGEAEPDDDDGEED